MRGAPVREPEENADGTRLQAGPRSRSHGRAAWALPRTLRGTGRAGRSGLASLGAALHQLHQHHWEMQTF